MLIPKNFISKHQVLGWFGVWIYKNLKLDSFFSDIVLMYCLGPKQMMHKVVLLFIITLKYSFKEKNLQRMIKIHTSI